jgi:phosphate transport system permease protein
MTAVDALAGSGSAPAPRPGRDMRAALVGSPAAGRGDRAFSGLAVGAGLLVLVILAGIAFTTTKEAWPAFRQEGLGFVFTDNWNPSAGHFGALALIYGTLLTALIALVIAVPVSVGIALFTTELAGRRLRGPLGMLMDLLAAVPSVVYGLWGVAAFGPALVKVYDAVAGSVGGWPVLGAFFGPPTSVRSFMTAGIVLAVMIVPIITSLSREVILTVPSAQREAALALGATRWEMIRGAIFPWARGGITGAVMLGLGRAMGETIAVALLIGNSAQISTHLFGTGDGMAGLIANEWGESAGTHRAALIGLGAVLFLITIAVNLTAQRIISRFDVGARG